MDMRNKEDRLKAKENLEMLPFKEDMVEVGFIEYQCIKQLFEMADENEALKARIAFYEREYKI